MKTPICDFVRQYANGQNVRAHMPGHKGDSILGCERYDITEIDGADVLYHSQGIIRESERNAESLFGTARTLYSCEGSSLSIRAMLYLAQIWAKKEGKNTRVLACRNAHKAFLCACALLDIEIEWLFSEESADLLSCCISAERLCSVLDSSDTLPCAVYLTSPDYLGNIADIAALGSICRARGVLLLVDNAHGAYLNFLPDQRHPITLGADMCCDSAHKTLPVLTGGGYLHISRTAPEICRESAESAMALFASTSPSYLILQSLDMANKYLSDGYRERLAEFCLAVEKQKKKLTDAGYILLGDEPIKVTIDAKAYGYTGEELADILRECGVECEFSDPDYCVLMLTPSNGTEDIARIGAALVSVSRRVPILERMPIVRHPGRALSPREAMLSPSCEIDVCDALGRVLAQPSVSCPPAIPVLVCGEVIDGSALRAFEYYGIEKCRVVEEK